MATSEARELEELRSDKLKLEIELENAMRRGEASARQIKAAAERSRKEVSQLQKDLDAEQSTRQAVEEELSAQRTTASTSDAETAQLRVRITSLESSNRDTLALLENKNAAYNALQNELAAKHQKTIELRRDLSSLEQTVHTAQSAASSAHFKESSLQQEVESLTRTNEWLDNELKTKSAEHAKFRREKSARITELQQQHEDSVGTVESLQRSEHDLRNRISELSNSIEERLMEMQALRGEGANKEEHFQKELDTVNRLNGLLNDSIETERRRNEDLSAQVENSKEAAARDIGSLNAEIETEHGEREAAERKVQELEVTLERLRSDLAVLSSTANAQAPATPRLGRSLNGPIARGSPAPGSRYGSPAPSGAKGSVSYTQVVSEYHRTRAELDKEKRKNHELNAAIDEMVRELEDNKPAIEERDAENARLEAHIVQMSTELEKASGERESARDEAERSKGEASALVKESELLRQQLRDLSAQIRVLLLEVNTQKQGGEGFTQEERSRLEALARGQQAFENMEGVSETDRVISQQLTTFRNIGDLQSQNEKLMRAVRELSDQVERSQHQAAAIQSANAQEETKELRRQLDQAEDKISSLVTISNSYIQERDMFRRIISNKAGSRAGSPFGDSTNGLQVPVTPARDGIVPTIEGSPTANEIATYSKLLKELQSHFDNYKTEAANDRIIIKNENDSLSRKNTELRTELSKKTGEATLTSDRYGMLQGNYTLLKQENAELQKRSQKLSDQAAKQEIRTQQVTEDLVETKGLLESMRNETANLKATKEFWKSVEMRLTVYNTALVAERDRLNILNANLQTLLNDREHNESETRRRLQSQVDKLEGDLQAERRKMTEEVAEAKRLSERRDYESQQSQKRIDDLITHLGSVREELAEARTTSSLLQTKADDLTIQLRSAEERVQVLQTKNATSSLPNGGAHEIEYGAGESSEQTLALEVSELRRDLDLTRNELSSARTEVEQYKAISHDAEAELASINDTQEQYRKDIDDTLEERNARISKLEKRIEELQSEITTLNAELNEKLLLENDVNKKLDEQKAGYVAEITSLRTDYERMETTAKFHQEDLKAQAQIAQQAQKNYEDELVKHADAAKALSSIRSECQEVKIEVVELRGQFEAAQVKLVQNEESWAEAKDRYENELKEINSRKNDLVSQNKILHQQLETLSSQLGELKKTQTATNDSVVAPITSETNWQELIKYIRREKEIVEVQFDLASQEAKRLRQQLDHTQTQLEETRLKLAQQRKAEENSERSALNHAKLMDTINELNLNRESNATLRLEKTELSQSLKEREGAIEELQAKIQPLNAKLQELEDSLESQNEELRMTREARERFEQRYLDVLHKSNSIDPAEHEGLKQQLQDIQEKCDEAIGKQTELQVQVDSIPGQIQARLDEANERFKETRQKLVDQSKAKAREQSGKIREKDSALQAAQAERSELETQLAAAKDEVGKANAEKEQAQTALANQQSTETSENVQVVDESLKGDAAGPSSEELQTLQDQLHVANNKVESATIQVNLLQEKVAAAEARTSELETELVYISSPFSVDSTDLLQTSQQRATIESNGKVEDLENRLRESDEARASGAETAQEVIQIKVLEDETITAMQESLKKLEEEAEELKVKLLTFEHAEQVQIEDRPTNEVLAEHVDGIRAELTARHEERVKQAEELYNRRTQSLRETLSKRLATAKSEAREAAEKPNSEALALLRQEHASEIAALNSRHAEELQELQETIAQGAAQEAEAEARVTEQAPRTYDPSEAEIRELISKNTYAKTLLTNNIKSRVKKAEDEQQAVFDKKMAEAAATAKAEQEKAVEMAEKKSALRMQLSENRSRAAQAKLDVVQGAAKETPKKAVGEVWEVAKSTKPPPKAQAATPPSQASQVAASGPGQQVPAKKTNPFANTQAAQTTTSPQAADDPGAAQSPTKATTRKDSVQSTAKSDLSGSVYAPPSDAPTDSTLSAGAASTTSKPPTGPANRVASGPGSTARGGPSGLPVAASRGRGQTSAPRGNVSNIGRGRGGRATGPGRGGSQAGSTGSTAPTGPQAQAGTTSGGMNAQAQAFVPAKRTREDSGLDGSVHAGNESKRQRGGGQSSA